MNEFLENDEVFEIIIKTTQKIWKVTRQRVIDSYSNIIRKCPIHLVDAYYCYLELKDYCSFWAAERYIIALSRSGVEGSNCAKDLKKCLGLERIFKYAGKDI